MNLLVGICFTYTGMATLWLTTEVDRFISLVGSCGGAYEGLGTFLSDQPYSKVHHLDLLYRHGGIRHKWNLAKVNKSV